jgi:hypothetical protein
MKKKNRKQTTQHKPVVEHTRNLARLSLVSHKHQYTVSKQFLVNDNLLHTCDENRKVLLLIGALNERLIGHNQRGLHPNVKVSFVVLSAFHQTTAKEQNQQTAKPSFNKVLPSRDGVELPLALGLVLVEHAHHPLAPDEPRQPHSLLAALFPVRRRVFQPLRRPSHQVHNP